MVDFKISINDPKTGKSYKKEVKDAVGNALLNIKIGDKVKGEVIDMTGYEFEFTGGSDNCGFPMRKDVSETRKKILTVEGVGVNKVKESKGIKQRKTVCGNYVYDKISQLNFKILKYGKEKLGEEAKVDDASAEAPKEA